MLVHQHGHVRLLGPHPVQGLVEVETLGQVGAGPHQVADRPILLTPAQGPEEIPHVDHAQKMVQIAVEEGVAGVPLLTDALQSLQDRGLDREAHHAGAGHHDLADRPLPQTQEALQPVVLLGGQGPSFPALGEDQSQLFR